MQRLLLRVVLIQAVLCAVASAIPNIMTGSLPSATVGTNYSERVTVSGNNATTWSISAGSLPPGLSLSQGPGNDATISGNPTTAGTYTFTVRAVDSTGADTQGLSIIVNLAPLTITTTSLPNATFNVPYSFTLQASGGNGSYTWVQIGGSMPPGLTLSPSGVISGTPTGGSGTFPVSVVDSASRTATRSFTLTVITPPLSITQTSLPGGTIGASYSQTLTATGGTSAGYSWSQTGTLPTGLSMTGATISGFPTVVGVSNFTARVTDSAGNTATRALSITINPAAPVVTTTSLPGGQVSQDYSQTLAASGGSGGYSWSVTTGSLPGGLTLSAGGVIAGKPTTVGTPSFTVTVTDSGGRTGSRALSIAISPAPLSVTTESLDDGRVGVSYSESLTAAGGTTPYQWAVASGALPSGLTLGSGGGITGTPTTFGDSNFTVRVTDSGSRTATRALSIHIEPPALTITTASLPRGLVGNVYTTTLEATGGSGGNRWSVGGGLPAGLSLNATAGTISGTPSGAATSNFTVTVTDNGNRTNSKALSIIVDPLLTITTASLPRGEVGVAYAHNMQASGNVGGVTWAVTGGNLPDGVALSGGGAFSGTPTTAATANFTVTATDGGGRTASKDLSIIVDPALTITTASLPKGEVGTAYSQSLQVTGNLGGVTWAVAGGALPAGVTLAASGAISGTPTAAGTANFTVRVTDGSGRSKTKDLSILIDPQLTITTDTLPRAQATVAYAQTLQASGNLGAVTWAVSGGALPAGVTLSAAGALAGTPTTAQTANFTARVTDAAGRSATKALSIIVDPPPLVITTATLPAANLLADYAQTLTATGGSGGYRWSTDAAALPAGLALSAAGAITGRPSAQGTRDFTVTVTDSGNRTASKPLSITVGAPLLNITTTVLPAGVVGTPYTFTLAAAGGAGGNGWSVTTGTLPNGLTLLPTGTINGTPTAAGTSNITIQVRDSANATATRALTLAVTPATLVITTQALPAAILGTAYNQTLAATGGTGAYRWSLSAGSLPGGLTLDAGGRITGTATGASSTFTVDVTDVAGAVATRNLSISVTPALNLPPATSLPSGVTGAPYNGTIAARGGQSPYTYSLASGQLPPGLALAATGAITGQPTQVGSFTFAISVRDATGAQLQSNFTIVIANTLTIIDPPILPAGSVSVAYQVTLTAAGGAAPFSWTVTAGSLPAGITFRPDGSIAGTPTSAGQFTFTVSVTDAVGGRTTKEFSLTIGATLTISSGSPLPDGIPATPYNVPLAAVGGTAPYVWIVSAGSLPNGLRLDASTGAITGIPEAPLTAIFTVTVTDSLNVTAQKAFTLTIAPGVTFANPATLPNAIAGTPYSFTLEATGGRAPYSWRVSNGTLPEGLALVGASGVISGTAAATGTFNFTIEVTDDAGLKATRVHTLVVELPTVAALRITGVPDTLAALQQPQVDLVLANPYPVEITGRLNLAFTPATGMPDDPAVQFSTGGRSTTFTIAANDTRAVFPMPRLLMQSGSVAGAIQFTVESLRAGAATLPNPEGPIGSAQVPAASAVVRSVEVRRTTGGFEVSVMGASTTRELARMVVRFRPPAGTTLQTSEVTVDLAEAARAWFQAGNSMQFGGQFTVTLPFSFVGGPSAIEAVSVILANALGSSQEVSGPY